MLHCFSVLPKDDFHVCIMLFGFTQETLNIISFTILSTRMLDRGNLLKDSKVLNSSEYFLLDFMLGAFMHFSGEPNYSYY